MSDPIPLDEARRRRRGGHDGGGGSGVDARGSPGACPVTALGHLDGKFWFLDVRGQMRALSARQLGSRADLVSLFGGKRDWLEHHFPKKVMFKEVVAGETVVKTELVGFLTAAAGEDLMARCFDAGLYGDHVVIRGAGVWRGPSGPILNVGNAVLVGDEVRPAGVRIGDTVFAAAAVTPRPVGVAPPEIARGLQEDIRLLWRFRRPGAEIIVLGLIGTGYLGAAAAWRSNGFLIGPGGCGKSTLLKLMRAAAPLHFYTNDASKEGIAQAVNGRAMAIFVDEAADRKNQPNAEALIEIVLAATGGDGAKARRGTADGKGRSVEVVGQITMASVSPPDMQAQTLSRFTLLELMLPEPGNDHAEAMELAVERAREAGPALWGRALAGFTQWPGVLARFREALNASGCAPREMDQLGTVLASWWRLTHDGLPSEAEAREGVLAVAEYVRRKSDVAQDDNGRLALQHLLSCRVQRAHTTDMVPIGELLSKAFQPHADGMDIDAVLHLQRHGIRIVRAHDVEDQQRRPVPRMAEGDGIWFSNTAQPLINLFQNSDWPGGKWRYALATLESARASQNTIRIGGVSSRALWISRKELDGD